MMFNYTMDIKYQKGKIYKISNVNVNNIMNYYGSTTVELNRRFNQHISGYKRKNDNFTVYKIFDVFGVENCKIELVELFPCNSKQELETRESFFIKNNQCVNKYFKKNDNEKKEFNRIKQKKYRENNLEKRRDYDRLWHQRKRNIIKHIFVVCEENKTYDDGI